MSDLGITSWAMQPYSHDFFPGQTRQSEGGRRGLRDEPNHRT